MKKFAMLLVFCCLGAFAAGCEGKSGEKMKEAVDSAKDAAEKTGEAIGHAAESAAKDVKEGADKVTDEAKKVVEGDKTDESK